MRTKNITLIYGLFLSVLIYSCNNDIIEPISINSIRDIKEITFNTTPIVSENTSSRTTFSIDNTVNEVWNTTDSIGIFPSQGAQTYFPMIEGKNTSSATFTGGGWALVPSAKYAAYYPFNFENRYINDIKLSYVGQRQDANSSTTNLGAYDYMAAQLTTPTDSNVTFNMEHLGSMLSFKVSLPEGTYKGLKLITDSSFVTEASLDMSKIPYTVTPKDYCDSIYLNLDNIIIDKENKELKAYMFLSPVDLSSNKFSLKMINTAGIELRYELTPTKFEASKHYQFEVNDYVIDDYSVSSSLDCLLDTLQLSLKNMVNQHSGYQCFGGAEGAMMCSDIAADDITWQTNTWMKASYLNWGHNQDEESGYNRIFWEFYYNRIKEANRLLEALSLIEPYLSENTKKLFNQIKGEALCIRGWGHLNLIQIYAERYNEAGNNIKPGIPYRESSTIIELPRHTVEEVYNKINKDLDEAADLLNGIEIEHHYPRVIENHYSEKVVYGLKARTAMAMLDYTNAIENVTKAISLAEESGNTLMVGEQLYHGFSDIIWDTQEALWASSPNDDETIYFYSFYSYMSWNFPSTAVRQGIKCINADTYDTMSETDLRRAWWDPIGNNKDLPTQTFKAYPYQNRKFKARTSNISVGNVPYMRLAELYLTYAEALARIGRDTEAQSIFTKFQITRDPSYVSKGNTGDNLIEEIMNSRRVELWGEGFRFFDLKRLNLPIKRGRNFDINFCGFLEKDADADGWVWEIPKTETDMNPLCNSNY